MTGPVYPGNMPPVDQSELAPIRSWRATTAAVVLIVIGALTALLSLLALTALAAATQIGQTVNNGDYALFGLQVVVSAVQIVSGAFVLRGKAWARTSAAVVCGVMIVAGFVNMIAGGIAGGLIGIAVNGALLGLLQHDEVRGWCRY